jgi:tetratricopeptide (TPR) repeat protein
VPLLFAAAVVPHALYVASIGGDHFEFRPVDLYVPLLFVLMGRGAAALCDGVLPRWSVAVGAAAVTVGLVAIPWQSHRQFAREYADGFPGMGATSERASFLDPSKDPVYRWPGLHRLAGAHRALLRELTAHLVGIRQEEHALFAATVIPEGRRVRELIEAGVLPKDTHVAINAVGAIPYYSDLRVLDRLGLTDAVVAKSAPGERRVMAHDRHATLDYAAAIGVDLWTEHPVYLLTRLDDDELIFRLEAARATGAPVYFAGVSEGEYIVARLPQGLDKTAPRFPTLAFHAATDDGSFKAMLGEAIEVRRRRVALHPSSASAWMSLGSALAADGAFADAAEAFRRAVAIDPAMGRARHNLGVALVRVGRLEAAIVELRQAVDLDPDSEGTIFTLGMALSAAGDRAGVTSCVRRLEALGTDEGGALARRLSGQGGGTQSPKP